MGQDGFVWWIGVVEDNNDPLLLGRAKVRIFGYHPPYSAAGETYVANTNNKVAIADLPWAVPVMPLNFPNAYGKISLGQWVFGFFLDGNEAQEPAMLGYLPSAYRQNANKFGKNETLRNFSDLGGTIPDGAYTAQDFASKSERFEWHTPSNHFIKMTDFSGNVKEFVLSHSTPNLFVKMETGTDGTSVLSLSHPSGTSIQLTKDDIIVKSPGGTYNLIDQLNWISLETFTTSGGDEYGPRTFNIGKRPPPPPPPPPRRSRGRGCFIENTFVTMGDGSKKKIVDVNIGEHVLSKDRKTLNKVKFIEIVNGEYFKNLYSPDINLIPFATMDHPIFIKNKLYSADPNLTETMYPWLGKQETLLNPSIIENTENKVYNLWVDGDGTYIVNDFATTSIIYDGGMLTKLYEMNLCSREKILTLYSEYTTKNKKLLHGAFLLNYFIGKTNNKQLYKFIAYCAHKEYNHPIRKTFITTPMHVISAIANWTTRIHKWRFVK